MIQKSSNINNYNFKNVYFRLIAILLPFFFLVLMEVILRFFSYGTDMHLFVKHNHEKYKDYYMVNPFVGEKYFNNFEATTGTNDIFLKKKPENGFRIFLMGSSTLYGFPYPRNLMASRILQERLQDAYPKKDIEVINTSITAINSITLKDYIKQIIDHDPDAVLIYAGHNEFYGAFGVGSNETMSKNQFLRTLHFSFSNFRIYQLMKSFINGILQQFKKSDSTDGKGTLMKRIVKDKDISYKSEKYRLGIEQFQNNLSDILKESKNSGVPVFLSDLVSNIKDLHPFGNTVGETHSAEKKYQQATNSLSRGDTLAAKDLFYQAKDLDPVRFRASEELNRIIYELAEQNEAYLITVKERFENASKGGLIGNNLLSEHVHPNIEGEFLLADAFYTKIVESGLIGNSPNLLTVKTKDYYRSNWNYTTLDSLIGEYKVKQLKSYWPFTLLDNEITFRDTFKTSGFVDSLAFTVLSTPDIVIDSLHKFLGDFYADNNQLDLACKEYEALVRINPYRSDYYNRAANCLLKLNDLYKAEKYLKKSVKYIETHFAHSMLGEIEFIKRDYHSSINAYESALELIDKDNVNKEIRKDILIKLYKLYQLTKNSENLNNIKDELSKSGQEFDFPIQSYKFDYSKYIPYDIEPIFQKALYYHNSDIDSSLYYLSVCLKTNDCPLVNYFIGNILYEKHDKRVLFFYNKAYNGYHQNPGFLVRLCIANILNKKKSQAKDILDKLIKVDPSYQDVARLKVLIDKITIKRN